MRLRISLLSVNEMGELGRIANEEDWRIVEYPVPVAFVRTQLDSKTTRITRSVRGSSVREG